MGIKIKSNNNDDDNNGNVIGLIIFAIICYLIYRYCKNRDGTGNGYVPPPRQDIETGQTQLNNIPYKRTPSPTPSPSPEICSGEFRYNCRNEVTSDGLCSMCNGHKNDVVANNGFYI